VQIEPSERTTEGAVTMKMNNVHPAVTKAVIEYSETISTIVDQYEFEFRLDGTICRFSHQNSKPVFDAPKEVKAGVRRLVDELRQFAKRMDALGLDPIEVSKFLGKYFRTDAKVRKALRSMRVRIQSDQIPIYDKPALPEDSLGVPGEQAENAG
jgi:hypothetical protein